MYRSFPLAILGSLLVVSGCPAGDDDATGDDDTTDPGPTTHYVDDLDDGQTGTGTLDDPFRDLQDAIDAAGDGEIIHILEGLHVAAVAEAVDPTCGNCNDLEFRQDIPISLGFHISGKSLQIEGASRTDTIVDTGAGYGLLFEDAGSSTIENLTITGGIRDADGKATDAAIVVKYTDLTVRGVDILDNDDLYDGKPDPVVGIIGIAGREGAVLTVVGCSIINCSWDGIALYRGDPEVPDSGPVATIVDNTIGCTEGCIFYSTGRGVGIGITWDARATIVNNRVHDYTSSRNCTAGVWWRRASPPWR